MTILRLDNYSTQYIYYTLVACYKYKSLGHTLWVLPILVCDGFIISAVDLVFGAVHLSRVDHLH